MDSHPDSAGRKPVEVGSSSLSEVLSKDGYTEVPVEKTEEERRCDEAEENSEAEPNVTREEGKTTNQAEDKEDERDGDKVVRLGKDDVFSYNPKCLCCTAPQRCCDDETHREADALIQTARMQRRRVKTTD